MRTLHNEATRTVAPADYAELFARFQGYMVALIRKQGFRDSDAEDVASEIMARFFERDFLSAFDPSLIFTFDGVDRPARFKSFLTKFVLAYLPSKRERCDRIARREVLHSAFLEWTQSEADHLSILHAVTSLPEDDLVDALYGEEFIHRLRTHLAGIPKRSPFDRCELVPLFDAVTAQIEATGEYSISELKDLFGVSTTAMHTWVWWLRANLAEALGRPCPAKRSRVQPTV